MIKQIPNHRQYTIDSETQYVYRTIGGLNKDKPIKQSFHKVKGKEFPNGYFYVSLLTTDLEVNNQVVDYPYNRPYSVHRLIALTFIDKPSSKHIWVNHKDGNKLNNTIENLEWTTIAENIQHAFDTGLKVTPKGAEHWMYGKKANKETRHKMSQKKQGALHPKFKGFYYVNFKRYESANQASIATGIIAKTIISRCKNPKFKLKGFYFVPIEDTI